MENSKSVDHHRAVVEKMIAQQRVSFERQGAVVESWRWRHGRRRGPYHRLAYRDELGRQRSVYLGPDAGLAVAVREMLRELQTPRREHRQFDQVRRDVRRELRRVRLAMDRELARFGLQTKGAEVRGWRTSQLGRRATAQVGSIGG